MRSKIGEILYVPVPKTSKRFNSGDWIFHTGSWTVCGELIKEHRGTCKIKLYTAPVGRTLEDIPPKFTSIPDALRFLSQYYEVPARQAKPSDLPDPRHL